MAAHRASTVATDIPVHFCIPAGPWQSGPNENTNGLLRQHFPKGTDLAAHTAEDLAAVAAHLNRRPRKTPGWETPAERLAKPLATASCSPVLQRPLEFAHQGGAFPWPPHCHWTSTTEGSALLQDSDGWARVVTNEAR